MPLPAPGSQFPPEQLEPVFDLMEEYDAWLSGDIVHLTSIYAQGVPQSYLSVSTASRTPGLRSLVSGFTRPFWAKRQTASQNRTMLHVPLAADIAAMSADLLWAEPPTFHARVRLTAGEQDAPEQVQARLEQIMGSERTLAELHEAHEPASALGGLYYRLGWRASDDAVWVQALDADTALPEFNARRELVAVNFWTAHHRDDGRVYRHFERHEPGAIIHALYVGTEGNVGSRRPLAEIEETRELTLLGFTDESGLEVRLPTGTSRLTAAYQRNRGRSLHFRRAQAPLAYFGASDYEQAIPQLSSVDEVWSSYMRDVKHGRSRLFVPDMLLNTRGPGKGAFFDEEQEVYTQLKSLDAMDKGLVQPQQFSIRWQEHEAAMLSATKIALRRAGLSAREYDERPGDMTATGELRRDKREDTTRDKKIRYASRALGYIASVALEVDALVFPGRGGAPGITVDLDFPQESQVDFEKRARTIGLLRAARVISMETSVRQANPEWDDTQVEQEVARLREEAPALSLASIADEPDPTEDDTEV